MNSATLIVSDIAGCSSAMHARKSSGGNTAPCEDRCPAGVGSSISSLIATLECTWQGLGDDNAVAAKCVKSDCEVPVGSGLDWLRNKK